jgi:hypothetical protein
MKNLILIHLLFVVISSNYLFAQAALCDLVVTKITVNSIKKDPSPTNYYNNHIIDFTAEFKNIGTAALVSLPTVGDPYVGGYLSKDDKHIDWDGDGVINGFNLFSKTSPRQTKLLPGETITVSHITTPTTRPDQANFFVLHVDQAKGYKELNEDNNQLAVSLIQATTPPSLAAPPLSLPTLPDITFKSLDFYYTIENNAQFVRGNFLTNWTGTPWSNQKNISIKLYLSKDDKFSSDDVLINSSNNMEYHIGYSHPETVKLHFGTVASNPNLILLNSYPYIITFIDSENVINESDETNNITALKHALPTIK